MEKPLGDVFFEPISRDPTRAAGSSGRRLVEALASTQVSIEGPRLAGQRRQTRARLRRATAVRDYLVSLGVPATRLMLVSKGKEQPVCTEEAEGCWSQNRRGHFVITAK